MADDGNGFGEYRLLILEALKRHERERETDRQENAASHHEILEKLEKLSRTVTINETHRKLRQIEWGTLGGIVVVVIREFLGWIANRGGP